MKLIESTPLFLSKVAELLEERKREAGGNLEYEQTNTLEYATEFGKLSQSKAEAMLKEISKIAPSLPAEQAVQMIDLLPKKEEEIKMVISSAKMELPDEQVKELAKLFKKHAKK